MNHISLKDRPRCYVKSPTAEDTIQPISGLISCTGVTRKWDCYLTHKLQSDGWPYQYCRCIHFYAQVYTGFLHMQTKNRSTGPGNKATLYKYQVSSWFQWSASAFLAGQMPALLLLMRTTQTVYCYSPRLIPQYIFQPEVCWYSELQLTFPSGLREGLVSHKQATLHVNCCIDCTWTDAVFLETHSSIS